LDSQTLFLLEIFNDPPVFIHLDSEVRVNVKIKVTY